MWEVVFPNIPVECGVVHSDINGFFNCSGQTIVLPSYYLELSIDVAWPLELRRRQHGGGKEDGSIPFLDTVIRPEEDGSFTIGVYRKPTHTDLYLLWDSAHDIAAKYSVIKTLTHRAYTICSIPELAKQELQHLEEVLGACKYPRWAIQKIFHKHQNREKKKTLEVHITPSVIL